MNSNSCLMLCRKVGLDRSIGRDGGIQQVQVECDTLEGRQLFLVKGYKDAAWYLSNAADGDMLFVSGWLDYWVPDRGNREPDLNINTSEVRPALGSRAETFQMVAVTGTVESREKRENGDGMLVVKQKPHNRDPNYHRVLIVDPDMRKAVAHECVEGAVVHVQGYMRARVGDSGRCYDPYIVAEYICGSGNLDGV